MSHKRGGHKSTRRSTEDKDRKRGSETSALTPKSLKARAESLLFGHSFCALHGHHWIPGHGSTVVSLS